MDVRAREPADRRGFPALADEPDGAATGELSDLRCHRAGMEIAHHLTALTAEGDLLRPPRTRIDHDAPVPGAPAWQVGDVVRHTGLVHRWAAAAVRDEQRDASVVPDDDGAGLTGAELVDWFRAGHAGSGADADRGRPGRRARSRSCRRRRRWRSGPGGRRTRPASTAPTSSPRGGPITPFDRAEALDGIDELLGGFAARPRRATPRAAPERSACCRPTRSRLAGPARPAPVRDPAAAAGADCVLRGTASDLHLLLWNRPAGGVETTGDPRSAGRWRTRVRVRWGGPGPRRPRS